MKSLARTLAVAGAAAVVLTSLTGSASAAPESGMQPNARQWIGNYGTNIECTAVGQAGVDAGRYRDFGCSFWVGWDLRADVIE